jgi:hypothetical protein
LKGGMLFLALLGFFSLSSCKHRRGPSVPEAWDPIGPASTVSSLQTIVAQSKGLRFLELFEDGFVITDSLTYRLDFASAQLEVERRFDPVPFATDEPLLIQKSRSWTPRDQGAYLDRLAAISVRQVPRCNPYGAIDGGYGGRFLILIDRSGREHRFGASDAECAASDHECSGSCLGLEGMNQALAALTEVIPIPEKPRTLFSCAEDSPLACAQKEFTVHGAWEGSTLRADIRRVLASRFCNLAAFTLEPTSEGHWVVRNSARESLGTVRFNTQDRKVSCLSRNPA